MYAKPGTLTGAVLEKALPPTHLWHRVIPQVTGPLRCQSCRLAEPPARSGPGGRATRALGADMSHSSGAGQVAAAITPDRVLRVELPADPRSARQARSAAHRAMDAWGMADLSGDTELLASELVANAVEHASGQSVGFVLRRLSGAEGQEAVTCEVSDSSPVLPEARDADPDADRGRGLAIVAALASASGVRASPTGKTTWFTLALSRCGQRAA
jgi:anti-sigma regulatory factor (Ser/Thr protein kinase)